LSRLDFLFLCRHLTPRCNGHDLRAGRRLVGSRRFGSGLRLGRSVRRRIHTQSARPTAQFRGTEREFHQADISRDPAVLTNEDSSGAGFGGERTHQQYNMIGIVEARLEEGHVFGIQR
jgi:hypothetical protein